MAVKRAFKRPLGTRAARCRPALKYDRAVTISLNGEPYDLPGPLTVSELLSHLRIDPRRVAIELNLTVLKRSTFDTHVVGEGDHVEIVNFVGGG
jgi:thiamine biosynthesis protein ThiS